MGVTKETVLQARRSSTRHKLLIFLVPIQLEFNALEVVFLCNYCIEGQANKAIPSEASWRGKILISSRKG